MASEPENYAAGRSGVGGTNYASSAWRAGDLERARIQREDAAARNRASLPQPATSSSSAYGGTYSESSGGGFTFFSVVAFVAASFYGIVTAMDYFIPDIRHTILPYIGPDGIVSKNVFFWGSIAILTIIGVLIRSILRWVFGISIVVAIVAGIVYLSIS